MSSIALQNASKPLFMRSDSDSIEKIHLQISSRDPSCCRFFFVHSASSVRSQLAARQEKLATKHDAQTFMLPRRHRLWKPATSSQNVEASSHPRFAYQAQNYPSLQQKTPTNNKEQVLAFLTMSGAHWSVRQKHRLQLECFVWTHLCCLVQGGVKSFSFSVNRSQSEREMTFQLQNCFFCVLICHFVVGCGPQQSRLQWCRVFALPFLSKRS